MVDVTQAQTQPVFDNQSPDASTAAPAAQPTQQRSINSPEMAKQVAQLIKDGKITGDKLNEAMGALHDYTKSYQYEQKAHGDVKNPVERMGTM